MGRLLVSDLDGTLLRSDGTLGPRTIETVNSFIAAGGLFTYATARSFTSASRVTSELQLTLPVVTYGGAIVVEPQSGLARPAKLIGGDTVASILQLTGRSATIEPIAFGMHDGRDRVCWLADRMTPGIEAFLASRPGDPRLLPLQSWAEIDLAGVFYLSLIGDRTELARIRDDVPTSDTSVVLSEDSYGRRDWWLEITSVSATKAVALANLRDEVGADELICFGDNHNDLTMFALADHAVAVGNAASAVLAAAAEVVASNDDQAVATWIASHPR